MPRVLIAGCGYLGQAVAELVFADGWEVDGLTMSSDSARQLATKPYPVRAVDISQADQVRAEEGDFDAVVHCASTRGGNTDSYRSVYFDGARNLLERFGNSRILFTSSTSVYAQESGERVTEKSSAEPKHENGRILREAEDLILANRGTVIRLGGIYGPGRSALLRKYLSGDAILDSENDRFVNQIHRDDAAAAIQLLIKRRESGGEIYNMVDDHPILQSECYRWLATTLNRPVPAIGKSTSKRKRGDSNKRVSNAKLRAIGWMPRFPNFAEGMGRSVLPSFNLGVA
jgi:nucleoside-diphosphate-sugar epimerase